MVWGDQPIDSLATQQLPQVDATMAFPVVGDEDLADMGPTRTIADQPAERHAGSHRKPHRIGLTARQTVGAVAAVGAVTFVAVLAFAGSESPGPAAVRQAAPDAPVATISPSPKSAVKRPVVRPVEPVVRRREDPAPVNPVHTVVVTVTAKPKATATPTPKPTSSSPKPTAIPTPDPTSPVPVETADPDEDPTPATEATDGDN